ncbi:glutamine--tRNA ligase/YqeY domain fusion protein [Geomonas sp. RF6]|uniref:glutamine--tRNA ligase/YqeY domain fusion protein n=1 Tax=Geomonas sp. RF6 TaxID=2897342 RepID=UPI001E336B33|nr:glutamine--tRNA ligase/YqeY domain fusion protein [Geomonas sp. RF6]UFS72366.1 glutamine--tRNA ligase/YqeY domain fusion protein [Geomonas sp. RF6]
MNSTEITAAEKPANFIRNIVIDDLQSGKHDLIVTRFPPEPNGYLHIGHAKSICLNFGLARDFQGRCHLRFDDTNPAKEEVEYEESIRDSVKWLGFDWGEHMYYASDYFERLFQYALDLIRAGKAYVDSLSAEEMRAYRGTLTEPGKESPYRTRAVEENLDLFQRMKDGDFPDGAHVLRAKIDMNSPNLNMRDPVIYRIKRVEHHRTGAVWCIYPMYDYAHCISDAIEGITHSVCTLEFEDHRPLYDWVLDQLDVPCHPRQIEFARLNLSYTVMSKRKLLELVQEKLVDGWDDPRMPTLVGLRRRGYTPESIRNFCETIGVGKSDSWIDMSLLEESVREDLNVRAPRAMAVLRPLKVVIEGYPEGETEEFEAANHPNDPTMGVRKVPFCREVYIERDDFMEEPVKGFFRLAPGQEVRLRYAYLVRCTEVIKDDQGEVVEVRCSYDPASRGGSAPDGRKVKGTIHWVSARHAVEAEVRVYDRLFTTSNPGNGDYRTVLNPNSKETLTAYLEPSLAQAEKESRFQFERLGYFYADLVDSRPGAPVFNRTATLRDSWGKGQQ